MTKSEALVSNYNKKELADMVIELTEKLGDLNGLEKQVTAEKTAVLQNSSPAVGMIKEENGTYHLVKLAYDKDTKAAVFVETEELVKDEGMASYKLQTYAVEKIFRNARKGMYDE